VEQIHDGVDEGTGLSGFHGYWARDWTNLDPNFGTKEDLAALVQKHTHTESELFLMASIIQDLLLLKIRFGQMTG
jgi:cupin superfamily acireductone dioxygenase involved in methionine salvage